MDTKTSNLPDLTWSEFKLIISSNLPYENRNAGCTVLSQKFLKRQKTRPMK